MAKLERSGPELLAESVEVALVVVLEPLVAIELTKATGARQRRRRPPIDFVRQPFSCWRLDDQGDKILAVGTSPTPNGSTQLDLTTWGAQTRSCCKSRYSAGADRVSAPHGSAAL